MESSLSFVPVMGVTLIYYREGLDTAYSIAYTNLLQIGWLPSQPGDPGTGVEELLSFPKPCVSASE